MLDNPSSETTTLLDAPRTCEDARILIVDDDRIVHGIVGKFLKRSNLQYHSVFSASEALEFLKSNPIDLILSDIVMPEMDGIEFCEKLRTLSDFKEVPVIFFTGLSDSETLNKAFEAGANDYVVKPLRQAEVISRAKRHLEEHFRKQADKQKISKLDKANKSKTKFLGVASHDLRNPLVSIRGISQYLESERFGELNDSQKELTQTITQASETMLSLVEDLLDVSKFESGQIKVSLKNEDLAEIIKTRVTLHSASSERKDISLVPQINTEDAVASLDKTLVARVIDNLVSNAVKFSPPGTCVEVVVQNHGENLQLIVQDEGPGIPPDEFDKLFKEFSRTSNLPTAGESSSGIGLYVCKQIVSSHKGSISVENRPEGGARFIINFNRQST
ncbi:hybrid sensor histidine kinase/response regulator [Puniceicoccaceae bacterium K14]|nr:hybrid sensor histidine kinase/response regulator [Puniceicoccaceae bacterium K14]